MTGININDRDAPFTEMILSGLKTIETRRSPSLHPAVGKRMAIVRTGVGKAQVVGTVTVGRPVWYDSRSRWDADRDLHRVPKGSVHDWQPPGKWAYPMIDPQRMSPFAPKGRGIVFRKVNPVVKQNPTIPPGLSSVIEPGDKVLDYDRAEGEDFYDLYDLIYTRRRPTTGEIEEVAGMLLDNGAFAVLSGDDRDLRKYFQKVGLLGNVAVGQGPSNPEVSRINAEKRRRK